MMRWLGGHEHPQSRRHRDHVAAFTARSTSRSQPGSTVRSGERHLADVRVRGKGIHEGRNHDAVMRIGGEAPRRRAHSKPRLKGHSPISGCRHLGSSSAAQHQHRPTCRNSLLLPAGNLLGSRTKEQTCRRLAGGHSRQSAMRSLRANATIMVLRAPPRASAVRLRYHFGQRAVLLMQ